MWKEERQGEEVRRRRRLRRGTRRKSDKFETDKSFSLSSDLLTVLMSLRKLWSYMIITRYIIIITSCVFVFSGSDQRAGGSSAEGGGAAGSGSVHGGNQRMVREATQGGRGQSDVNSPASYRSDQTQRSFYSGRLLVQTVSLSRGCLETNSA